MPASCQSSRISLFLFGNSNSSESFVSAGGTKKKHREVFGDESIVPCTSSLYALGQEDTPNVKKSMANSQAMLPVAIAAAMAIAVG